MAYRQVPVAKVSGWFGGDLEAAGLWVLLVSDARCGPCGCYQVSPAELWGELCIPKDRCLDILARMTRHVVYRDRWVALRDFQLFQGKGPKWDEGIRKDAAAREPPPDLVAYAGGSPIDTLSIPYRRGFLQEQEHEQEQEQDRNTVSVPSGPHPPDEPGGPPPAAPDGEAQAQPKPKPPNVQAQAVFDLYRRICVPAGLGDHRDLTDGIRKAITARWRGRRTDTILETRHRSDTLGWWEALFRLVAGSRFLRGENDRGWRADLLWICGPKNLEKILAGAYHRETLGPGERTLRNVARAFGEPDPFAAADHDVLAYLDVEVLS